MKKNWKIVYVLLVIGCLACIGSMLIYLQKDQEEEFAAEQMQEQLKEQYVAEETEVEDEEEVEIASLPIDFEGLQEINPEIYAWIEIPDTKINYPIVQHGGEDQSYYLTRNIYGEHNQAGSIYTEDYNNKDFQDYHTVIYGHNMKNGSMFHNLRYFAKKEYFDEHHEMFIYMPGKILKYEIITCYEYDDRHLLGMFDFDDTEAYGDYLKQIMKPRSMYTMVREEQEVTAEDKLVTLSTCVANKPNSRRLLQAVLLEEIPAEYKGVADETTDETKH